MSEQRILHIRESISVARELEKKNQTLKAFVAVRLPNLHRIVSLPEENREEYLVEFVTSYIQHVPDFIEALHELTESAGIHDYAEVFLTIAEDYFIDPPELVNDHSGLHQLIDEAYLAHRLFEEVNDRVTINCGLPLAPMDMTMSNIIIHEMLGDEFANQLDLAVHYSIESFFKAEHFSDNPQFVEYMEKRKQIGWQDTLEKWPCLAGDSAISLDLDSDIPGEVSH